MNIKNLTSRPGFEFVFAVGIAAVFILPAAVMAQDNKNIEISITNGDTVINGKNIKDLSPQQREVAMKDLDKIRGLKGRNKAYSFERNADTNTNAAAAADGSDLGTSNLNIVRTPDGYMVDRSKANRPLRLKRIMRDTSLTMSFKFNPDGGGDNPRTDTRERRGPGMDNDMEGLRNMHMRTLGIDIMRNPNARTRYFKRRGSQSFSYTNTDDDNITTSVNFHVFDHEYKMAKGTGEPSQSNLNIIGLKLVADFATGKTLLMFNLPSKAPADVEFTDSKGNVLWKAKSSASNFSKDFALPLNGNYQLKVKQGGKSATKDIMKEE